MNKGENIIKNLIYIFMVFSLAYIFGLVIKLDISLGLQSIFILLVSLITKFFILNPMFIYLFVFIALFSFFLLNQFFPLLISPFFQRTRSLLTNIFLNLTGYEQIASENTLLFWLILNILLSFLTGFIIFKKKRLYPLLPIYMGFFLYYWYSYIDAAYWMMILFLFLFFIYMTLIRYNMEIFSKDKLISSNFKDLYKPWMKTGIIYGIIIIFLAISLPKTSNLIKWPWLQNKVFNTFPEIENWRSSSNFSRKYGEVSYFDFSSTGYNSNPSKLGGPVELSDKKIMTVYSDEPQYLRGNIRHRYTGEHWEIVGSSLEDYRSGNDFSDLSNLEKRKYYTKTSIHIVYNSFSSKTIFTPYRPGRINLENNSKLKVDKDFGLFATDGVYTGESYRVTAEKPLHYKELIDTDISYKKDDILNLNKYLEIPEDKISQATRDLTKDIVSNIENDIDKALEMENFLRNNFPYSLDVSSIPDNHEFIDYFLFQEKKGYCTYYATTLAIMLRLEGIPSRYIEGYLAKDSDESGIYEVSQENAHTWVEAFIEPFGWISLEATPAYPSRSNYVQEEESGPREEIVGNEDSTDSYSDILENNKQERIEEQGNILNENTNKIENESNMEANSQSYLGIFLAFLFAILPLRLFFVYFKVKLKDKQIKKLPPKKRIIYLYDDIINLTTLLGYPQILGETHGEYADRIAFNFYYFDDKGIREITDIFIKNKYGNSTASEDDIFEMENFKANLNTRIKNHLGFFGYLKFYLKQ